MNACRRGASWSGKGAGARWLAWGLLACLAQSLQVHACEFPPGFFYRQEINPGALFVGRDAPIGTVIQSWTYLDDAFSGDPIRCPAGSAIEATSPLPKIYNSPWVPSGEVILQTRIPGIGLVVSAHMLGGSRLERWAFTPAQGHMGFGIPYVVAQVGDVTPSIISTRLYYRIIKIGPIDSGVGPQSLAGHVLAEFTSNSHGRVLEMVFASGTVDEALCGLPGAPIAQVTVPMGTWRTGQFHDQNGTTDPVAFNVPLQACQGGTLPGNQNFASLRLDPRNGSSVLDAQRGILGLNKDSDASGVGVQVLRADHTPMPLTEEVQMTRLSNGDVQIPMAARYIQVGKSAPVGGVANASLGFTLTYQ